MSDAVVVPAFGLRIDPAAVEGTTSGRQFRRSHLAVFANGDIACVVEPDQLPPCCCMTSRRVSTASSHCFSATFALTRSNSPGRRIDFVHPDCRGEITGDYLPPLRASRLRDLQKQNAESNRCHTMRQTKPDRFMSGF